MEVKYQDFPLEIEDLDPELNEHLIKYFLGKSCGYVRVGPKGYLYPNKYKEQAANIYNMEIRPSDIFIDTFPRSGTTWVQELIWLLANNVDFATAKAIPLVKRFPFLEMPILFDPVMIEILKKQNADNEEGLKELEFLTTPVTDIIADAPSPRFIKTHLPLSLLPPTLLDTAKVVFVARDPRDAAVSFYHHNKLLTIEGFNGDFKTYWNLFINNLIHYTPFFEITKEAWNRKDHANMLFLFYEDLLKDLPGSVRRVAKFLDKQLTEQQIEQLCEHLRFDNFKKNKSVNVDGIPIRGFINDTAESFTRKGKAGGWRDYFDEEMTRQAERWIADNLRDTDLTFL